MPIVKIFNPVSLYWISANTNSVFFSGKLAMNVEVTIERKLHFPILIDRNRRIGHEKF